jgi:predicted helicase
MENKEKHKIEKFLNVYFEEIQKIYLLGDFREESFYPALKQLLERCFSIFSFQDKASILVLPKKTEAGIPDFRAGKNGEIIGYIEAKSPDANLNEIEDTEQLKRYRESFPNLILTNFLEFRLFRNGNLQEKVEVGRQNTLLNLKHPPVPEKLDLFFEFLEKFYLFSIPEIEKSYELSKALAKRTRFLEHILLEELLKENEEIKRFYRAFQEELIETLTKERFADLYAQTITYGLFAARMKIQNGFKREIAWKSIPESLPLLKEIFYSMTGPHFPESLIWVVDDITQVLEKANIPSILQEFKTIKWDEDPVIHFYETFLATYNPVERERLGVYYTPLPVVSYIVSSIHNLLKEKLGKSEGLATNDVTLLDPAAGTLTFVVQAIKQVQKELEEKNKKGLIKSYIEEHILKNFYAFEILVAPYTVGHFKVSMVLEEMGYRFKLGERFKFYLTNTLEMKEPKQMSFLIDLAKEGMEAKRIKEKVPILVVLGNPPYSFKSAKSKFIDELMKIYKEDVRTEKKSGVLEDDYIKFIRFAHWKIEQAGKGILGFVTNNSYLYGVIHRGMRMKLLDTFDEIYILNLHGSSRIGEKTPEGAKDENVFDIQQGVAIAIYLKMEKTQKEKKVFYADLWGKRKDDKYPYLLNNDVKTTKWHELKPVAPYYFFVPKDFELKKEYNKFWKTTEIFNLWGSGIITRRDTIAVAFKRKEMQNKMFMFTNLNLTDSIIGETFKIVDTIEWNLHKAREHVKKENINELIKSYHYRPLDFRYIYYSEFIISRTCKKWMKHLLRENLAIITTRIITDMEEKGSFISNTIGDIHSISGQSYFFPLYLYPDEPVGAIHELPLQNNKFKAEREINFTSEFLKAINESLGKEPTPEEIFFYIYAVLYSPTYRKRYEEFLKIDFPRIPLPSNLKYFQEMSNLGRELVDLHLLKHTSLSETDVGFPIGGSNTVEKVKYDENSMKVYINKEQYFENISEDVWKYRIGAYPVIEKYLKDRKKRKLSLDEINHYMKVSKAIKLTIEIQRKIDEIFCK